MLNREIETFLAVVAAGSVNKAARLLNITLTFPGNPGHRFTRRISRFRSFPGSCTRFRNEAAFCCRTFLYT